MSSDSTDKSQNLNDGGVFNQVITGGLDVEAAAEFAAPPVATAPPISEPTVPTNVRADGAFREASPSCGLRR